MITLINNIGLQVLLSNIFYFCRDTRTGTTTTTKSKPFEIQELEMLLEAYFVQIDGILNKLSTVCMKKKGRLVQLNIMLLILQE